MGETRELEQVYWKDCEKEFVTKAGYHAAIAHGPMGGPLGYIDIHDHPLLRDLGSDTIDEIEVHGGVTWNGEHDRFTNPPRHIIGFDCCHSFDMPGFGGETKDGDYMVNELESLAKQLKEIELALELEAQ